METRKNGLNTIRFYIILKPLLPPTAQSPPFEYYTFLHHSQTVLGKQGQWFCLNTIRFYIILKHLQQVRAADGRLNTIRFYIILKPQIQK